MNLAQHGIHPRPVIAIVAQAALRAAVGGSFYYVLAGGAIAISAIWLWRGDARGAWTHAAMTYLSQASSRQYVIIAAGGRPGMVTRLDTRLVAFALPE